MAVHAGLRGAPLFGGGEGETDIAAAFLCRFTAVYADSQSERERDTVADSTRLESPRKIVPEWQGVLCTE